MRLTFDWRSKALLEKLWLSADAPQSVFEALRKPVTLSASKWSCLCVFQSVAQLCFDWDGCFFRGCGAKIPNTWLGFLWSTLEIGLFRGRFWALLFLMSFFSAQLVSVCALPKLSATFARAPRNQLYSELIDFWTHGRSQIQVVSLKLTECLFPWNSRCEQLWSSKTDFGGLGS